MRWEQKTRSPKYLWSHMKQFSPPYQCVSPCSPSFGHSREWTFLEFAENQAWALLAGFHTGKVGEQMVKMESWEECREDTAEALQGNPDIEIF